VRVATLEVDFRIPGSDSLKSKRKVVASLRDRIRARFPVAVAEVDHQDLTARGVIGVAAVGGEGAVVEHAVDEVLRLIESEPRIVVVNILRESY
jgi:hypothetical protein